jgi:hypothetical protein
LTILYDSSINEKMKPESLRESLKPIPVSGSLSDPLEARLHQVAKQLGFSWEEILLLSLQRGLDILEASSKQAQDEHEVGES